MNTRRKFLGALGLGLGASAVPVAAAAVGMAPKEPLEGKPNGWNTQLVLNSMKAPKGPVAPNTLFIWRREVQDTVGIAVGEDGHLWLKTHGKWARVVTEN